jgi:AraC-like DNA-binding protein
MDATWWAGNDRPANCLPDAQAILERQTKQVAFQEASRERRMIRISTDAWAPAERLDRWREEFGSRLTRFEVTASDRPRLFAIDMLLQPGPTMQLTRNRVSAARKRRDGSWLKDGSDTCFIAHCRKGELHVASGERRAVVRAGEAVLLCAHLPLEMVGPGTVMDTLNMPRAVIARLVPPEAHVARVLPAQSGALRLLEAYVRTSLSVGLIARRERHLAELVADALLEGRESVAGAGARSAARLDAARRLIDEQACTAGFDLARVAKELGKSVRTLERDFAAAGTRFADEVTARRLDRAAALLGRSEAIAGRIADLAFAVGFNDLSHFNRAFRARFGATPTDYRLALQGRQPR